MKIHKTKVLAIRRRYAAARTPPSDPTERVSVNCHLTVI
jgi:hypothetical protein